MIDEKLSSIIMSHSDNLCCNFDNYFGHFYDGFQYVIVAFIAFLSTFQSVAQTLFLISSAGKLIWNFYISGFEHLFPIYIHLNLILTHSSDNFTFLMFAAIDAMKCNPGCQN